MNTHVPYTPAELVVLAQHHAPVAPALLGHLLWCLHTAGAGVVAVHGPEGHGLATWLWQGEHVQVMRWLVQPKGEVAVLWAALWKALCAASGAEEEHTVLVQGALMDMPHWASLGFVEQVALEHWTPDPEGGFEEAERDEVLPFDPTHTLALLHLDRNATGEHRATLLLEHAFAARVYEAGGRVRGILLPVLGNGLILADRAVAGLELQRWLLPVVPRIVVPEGNAAAAEQLHAWGYTVVNTELRLVRGTKPRFRPELVYAWPW